MLNPEHQTKNDILLQAHYVPIVVGTRDGSCFYGEAVCDEEANDFLEAFRISSSGGIHLRLNNCQMMLGISQTTKGWFDLAGRGPDVSCVVSPPVDCAVISEITKIISCSQEASSRWKAQGAMGTARIIPARTQ